MIRRDDHFHTAEQVAGYMDDAYAIVKDADVPDEWKRDAFLKAVDLLAAKNVVYEQNAIPDLMRVPRGRQN